MDKDDNGKNQASHKLMAELSKGEQSGKEKGWLDMADVETKLGVNRA